MKQTKLALSAVMIVAVGLIGTNFVTGSEMTEQEKINAYVDSSLVKGHVTLVHSDPQGNILSYIQTDNLVTNEGKDCMAERVFGGTAGSACPATSTTDAFTTIGLFNGQSFPLTANASSLAGVLVTASGLAIGDGVAVPSQNAAAIGADYGSGTGAKADIFKQFTAGTTQTVDGAGLYNVGADAILAGQVFTSTILNNLDTLDVTWTITVG